MHLLSLQIGIEILLAASIAVFRTSTKLSRILLHFTAIFCFRRYKGTMIIELKELTVIDAIIITIRKVRKRLEPQ